MNGGVYRKPNQCPNCGHLQDENLDARNRPKVLKGNSPNTKALEATVDLIPQTTVQTPREVVNGANADHDKVEKQVRIEPIIGTDEPKLDNPDQKESIVTSAEKEEKLEPEAKEEIPVETSRATDSTEQEQAEIESLASDLHSKKMISRSAKKIMNEIKAELKAKEPKAQKPKPQKPKPQKAIFTAKPIQSAQMKVTDEIESTGQKEEIEIFEPESSNISTLSDHRDKETVSPKIQPYGTVMLTTESSHNLDIREHLDVLTADLLFSVESHVNESRQNVLKAARKKVLNDLRKDAYSLGANAVVDVKISYNEIFSGDVPKMLFMATGTAVVIQEKHLKKKSRREYSSA